MSKIDTLFLKIIADERIVSTYGINTSKYRSLAEGKKEILQPQVRAVAEIVEQLNTCINKAKDEMTTRNKVGPVVLNDADFEPIYNKVVAMITK